MFPIFDVWIISMTGQRTITCSLYPCTNQKQDMFTAGNKFLPWRMAWHGWIFPSSWITFVVSIRSGAQHVEPHLEPYVEPPMPPSPPPSPAVALILPVQREEEVVHEESLFPAPRGENEAGSFQLGWLKVESWLVSFKSC